MSPSTATTTMRMGMTITGMAIIPHTNRRG